MPEVLTMPELETEISPEVLELAEELGNILDPEGSYRWDLPAKMLEVGDEDYEFFVCRTSLLLGLIIKLQVLHKKHLLPEESDELLADAIVKLDRINGKPGRKTQADMQEIRRQFNRAMIALKSA